MHKKKFTENQRELIALLPQGLPTLTDGAKLVLGQIIMLYGTDFAQANGYVYRSTTDMMKDTEISSKTTLARANRLLSQLGLMTVKSGSHQTRTANEYRLSNEMLDKINFKQSDISTLSGDNISTLSNPIGTLCGGIGTLSNDISTLSEVKPLKNKSLENSAIGTLSENEVINELRRQNESLLLIINELHGEVKRLSEKVETMADTSKCTTETDTESDTDKNYYKSILTNGLLTNMENFTTNESEPTKEVENSEASAFSSFSSLNSEKENHADTNTNEDATPSTDNEPANDNTISTSISSVVSELSEKPLYIQPLEENPPQVAPLPPFTEWFTGIKREIRQGIFQWSITLTDDVVKTDDANKIVHEVLTNHPEWENYVGQFSFCDLTNDTIYKMENRVKNADVRQAIKENQYQERHKRVMAQLLSA